MFIDVSVSKALVKKLLKSLVISSWFNILYLFSMLIVRINSFFVLFQVILNHKVGKYLKVFSLF